MEIAVLSDIHGNYVALEKCITYALDRKINTFIFLGDYVGELAYPQKTMRILYELRDKFRCYFIRGNKEDYWINYEKNGEQGWREYDSTTGSLFYAYHNLTEKDRAFFKGLPHKMEVCFDGWPPITICHGSPNKVNEKMLPNDRTYETIENDANAYILCGHTHIQDVIEHNGKYALNAGSVGVSLRGYGKAQFMIMKGSKEEWNHEFVSLDYDVDSVIFDLHASGLSEKAPCWCKVTEHLLKTGEVSHGVVLARAMALCKENRGECKWPDVPERCWKQAVDEMIGI